MLVQGFNQDINWVPQSLFDWLREQQTSHSEMEYQLYFSKYKSEAEKELGLEYERIYGPMPRVRQVSFPRPEGVWAIKIIGDQVEAFMTSGLLGMNGSLTVPISIAGQLVRAYIGRTGNFEEQMIPIKHLLS